MSAPEDVIQDCQRMREAPRPEYTVADAVEDAKWVERTPDGVLSPDRARQVIAMLHAALQASPCYYKAAQQNIPTFVLLGYDLAGHEAMIAWIAAASKHGCRPEKLADAIEILSRWKKLSGLRWPT